MSIRDRYNAFIDRHEVAWELSFAALAVVYVGIGSLAANVPIGQDMPFIVADWILTLVFATEFGTRIYASRDRRGYLRGHWIDLVALIPTTRALRALRILRLLRLVRAFAGLYRGLTAFERLAQHKGLALLYTSWLGLMMITSLIFFVAESEVNDAITTPWDALWWGITTITTVGYGDTVPQTAEGKIAASIMMLLGIGLFSAITATITSFVLTDRRGGPDLDRALASLHAAGVLSDEEFLAKKRVVDAEARRAPAD